MASKKTKWSMDEKIRIVLQTFKPEIKVAELCREHNLAPRTPYIWKEKFLEGGRESLKSPNTGKNLKKHARKVDTLKKIIGEYAVANEALKKRWEEAEDEGSSRGKKEHQPGKVAPVLRHLQDRVVLHKKAQERGDGSPDGDEDQGDCREEAHIRHAPDGRPACQAVWTARKLEEG